MRISKLPLGSIAFQEGESFDCGICYDSHYSVTGTKVVQLECGHVYHSECMRAQIAGHSNKYCVLCHKPVNIVPKPEAV